MKHICQELNCKKYESKDHVGTLCKKHAEIVDKASSIGNYNHDPLKYKTTNERNNVWEGGLEYVRSTPTDEINKWIKQQEKKKIEFEAVIKHLGRQIETIDEKIQEYINTRNMRYKK